MAEGDDWFVNWADFPSVRLYRDQHDSPGYFAHWLHYSGEGTYDYDIRVLHDSLQTGRVLHTDGVSAEHGFLSSAQLPAGGLQVSWLDGRHTKAGADAGAKPVGEAGNGHGHGSGGAMTLRTKALHEAESTELDNRVCDCCNTATIANDSFVMVAYRDRSEHEIRDISYVLRYTDDERWSTPKSVHADNWKISGCPVNGPALASSGTQNIAIVWYTAPRDRARINFSRYDPVNDRFFPPLVLDDDAPTGRVDLQLAADGTAYATGLTAHPHPDSLKLSLWTISPDDVVRRETLAVMSAGRSSGFPKIALYQNSIYWARTVTGAAKDDRRVEVCHQATGREI